MQFWRGFIAASLLGATLVWTSLPAGEELHERQTRRPTLETLKRLTAPAPPPARRIGKTRDAMKLVVLSCLQSR